MEQIQSNRVKMYGSTSKFLHDHPDQVNSIPRFLVVLGEFDGIIGLIMNQEVHRTSTSEGKTELKHDLEEEMILEAVNVSSSLRAYAAEKKLIELMSIVKVSIRKLDRMKEQDLITKCTQIYNEAKKLENDLGNYGLTAEEISRLKEKIDAFGLSGKGRDSSVAERKGTRSNIIELFNRADELLEEQLDVFVNKFIAKDKLFYEGYFAAREIKAYGVRHNRKEENPGAEANNPPATT